MEGLEILVLVCSFIFFLLIGVPVAFSVGLASILSLLVSMDFLPAVTTLAQRTATSLDSFTLLAIPFFVLAGQLMNKGGIAFRLVEFAKVLVGWVPGGLAFVNITANMLFGTISGSSAAAASAVGTIMHPRMVKEGYDKHFSAALNITSATTGLLIPPSNILIVYSLASGGVSIAALFVAGYVPGILMGALLMLVAVVHAYRKKYPVEKWDGVGDALRKFLSALPSLFLLVVVIGGIIAGIFTATEASAIAVVYCFVLSLIYREVKISDLPEILINTVITTTIVLLLVATSLALSWVMSYENIPQTVSSYLLALSNDPFVILIIINIILLIVGTFMDMTPAVLIFTPIFLPIVLELGVNPIHFGVVMVMNLCVGICTPPVGTLLFVGCSIADVKIHDVIRPLLPFFLMMVTSLLLVTYLPELSLWLPEMFGL